MTQRYLVFNKDSDWKKGYMQNLVSIENCLTVMKENHGNTKEDNKFQKNEELDMVKGIFITPLLDSLDADTVWHRYELDADIPKETQIKVSYFSCDNIDISKTAETLTFNKYIKNNTDNCDSLSGLWTDPVINPKDALLLNSTGRYLCLRLEFIGNSSEVPLLRSLKVIFPRNSYLRYLPSVYHQNKSGSDFLERFLSIFETVLMDMETRIDTVSRYFDIDTAEGEYARWLATWLGIEPDSLWDENKLKELVRHAPEIYKRRGTPYAIKTMIKIVTDDVAFIVEQSQLKDMEDDNGIRSIFQNLYGENQFVFYVVLKPGQIKNEAERKAIDSIIKSQKPAHTDAVIVDMQPVIYLDLYSYLEINSYLSKNTSAKLGMGKIMPHNTILK